MLLRFQEIVEAGQIFGPYRGYLYYWRTHDTGIIAATLTVLWPWLTPEKKAQAARTLGSVPALWCTELLGEVLESHIASAQTNVERHAWAAGFFEGDGSIGMYPSRPEQSGRRRLNVSIGQASAQGVPTSLRWFREIVGTGNIFGPVAPRGWSRLPQYRWQAQGQPAASAVGPLLPWIVGPKRAQIAEAVALT